MTRVMRASSICLFKTMIYTWMDECRENGLDSLRGRLFRRFSGGVSNRSRFLASADDGPAKVPSCVEEG
jgi:hypothetical protein